MSTVRLQFTPGVDVESTQTASRGGWNAANLVRFTMSFIEKLRGWAHITTQAMVGVCREIHYWADLASNQWIGAGTNSKLYVEREGQIYDITPLSGFTPGAVSSGNMPFSLLIWSIDNFGEDGIMVPSGQGIFSWTPPTLPAPPVPAELILNVPALLVGGLVTSNLPTWHLIHNGGFTITINGVVTSPLGLDFSGITGLADAVAIIQAALGGAVVVSGTITSSGQWQFSIQTVLETSAATLTFATGPVTTNFDLSTFLKLTFNTATSLRTQGGGAPPHNQGALVTMPQRIVMAFGSSPDGGTEIDPLLIRWSDQDDFSSWAPTVTNQAGSFRLPRGNRIVGVLQAGIATYLWTQYEFWTAQYSGFPFVFGFFQQGASCGLIAQNAAISLGTTIYWMGDHGFFLTTGSGFQQIPCSVWDYVYLDIDDANQDKCFAGADYHFREVFFFFPSKSGGSGEIDSYVKFNTMENLWDTGRLVRTAWDDLNPGTPIAIDIQGIFQRHDVGHDADGQPMTGVSATSGFMDMTDGNDIVVAKRIIPDNIWEGANPSYNLSMLIRSFPGDTIIKCGPFQVTPQTDYITLNTTIPALAAGAPDVLVPGVRGREIAFLIECDTLDTWFRLGNPRVLVQPDGTL